MQNTDLSARHNGTAGRFSFSALSLLLVLPLFTLAGFSQVSVTTQHNDIGRTGQNVNETVLTPANVNATSFGRLFTQVVDGPVYAQPLYLPGIAIPAKGTHNVVFVATENDSVYAFDADTNGGVDGLPLWSANLATTAYGAAAGATSVPSLEIGEDISPVIGITGTPVIDPVNGTMYVVSFTQEASAYVLRLHALSITTGQEHPGSPVTIQASTTGTGNGSSNNVLTFDPKWENQRPGLLLLDGVVYIGFAAHGDQGPWHGWILGYDEKTLAQVGAFCASPNGVGGGYWMSGAGLAADTDNAATDPKGRIFAVTGNGDFDATAATQAGADFGDSIVELSLLNGALTPTDFFTPEEQAYLDESDGDLGAGGAVVIPDADSATPLLLQSGKEGRIYLLNRGNLGGYHSPDQIVQELSNGTTSSAWGAGLWGLPAYWNKTVYFPGRNAPIQAFALNDGLLSTTPFSETTELMNYPGPSPSVSANGTTNGIVWLLESSNPSAPGAVLEAYDALNLQSLLYSSQTNATRDGLSPGVKFSAPTVVNGKVYAASTVTDATTGAVSGQINVFGLLAGAKTAARPAFTPAGETFTPPLAVTIADGTPGAKIYYTTDGSTPSALSTPYVGPISINSNQTITAIASVTGYLQSAAVSQTYTSKTQVPDPVVTPANGIEVNAVTVTLKESLKTASVYYTTDGTTPTNKSNLYSKSFSLTLPDTGLITLKAIALASGLTSSNVITRQYEITVEGTAINCGGSTGFTTAGCAMQLNGGADLDDVRLQLTNGAFNQATSAFFTTPVEISAFTTDFSFQLTHSDASAPFADGFTFTLQGAGPTAAGASGAGLGYAGISLRSVAMKFDFFNDAGEGTNSIGVYVAGANPTVPAVSLAGSGINIGSNSNDQFAVHLVYTGSTKTLDFTITDLTLGTASWSTSFNVDIQTVLESTTAYAGFTGSTNATGTSSQKILGWTYQAGISPVPPTAPPVFSVGTGTYPGTQSVMLTEATAGAKIYYTTDGNQPTTSSRVYSTPIIVAASQTINANALAPDDLVSAPVSNVYTISGSLSYSNGFSSTSGLSLNGSTAISGTSLQLTNGATNEAGSAFFAEPLNIQSFTTSFTFQLINPAANGFTFTIQNVGPTALGSYGGSLGYRHIGDSVAIKFDLYNSGGEGPDSTGIYTNGANPTVPAIDLTGTRINLHSGDTMRAYITYDGTTLNLTITDTVTHASWSHPFTINIPATVGSNTAYVGFTGGTGGLTATQKIHTWSYQAGQPLYYSGGFSTTSALALNGSAAISGTSLELTNGGQNEAASAFYATPVNIQSFATYFHFQLTNPNADGFTFTIQNAGPTALGSMGGSLGYQHIGASVAIKFDLYNSDGEGPDSTGLYTDGANPTAPAIDLSSTGINLHSGDTMDAAIVYDGTTLTLTLTDLVTKATWSHPFTVDVPSTVGGNTAYVGFTGGTGGLTSIQKLLAWTLE